MSAAHCEPGRTVQPPETCTRSESCPMRALAKTKLTKLSGGDQDTMLLLLQPPFMISIGNNTSSKYTSSIDDINKKKTITVITIIRRIRMTEVAVVIY